MPLSPLLTKLSDTLRRTGMTAAVREGWDRFGRPIRLGLGGVSLAVGVLLPGTMPFTVAGLYILTKESQTMRTLLAKGRERFPKFFDATFKLSRWAENWVRDTGVYKWAVNKLGRDLPPITQDIDTMTRPQAVLHHGESARLDAAPAEAPNPSPAPIERQSRPRHSPRRQRPLPQGAGWTRGLVAAAEASPVVPRAEAPVFRPRAA